MSGAVQIRGFVKTFILPGVAILFAFHGNRPLHAQESSVAEASDSRVEVKLDGDRTWGLFETPTLAISLDNQHPFPLVAEFESGTFKLTINGQEFHWTATDTSQRTAIPASSVKDRLFVMRLDSGQWSHEPGAHDTVGRRLRELSEGLHRVEVEFRIESDEFAEPRTATARCQIAVVSRQFASTALKGSVVDHQGQPVVGAQLYPFGKGYMVVRSGIGSDSSFTNSRPTYMKPDEDERFRGRSDRPANMAGMTGEKGRFEIIPDSSTRAILVLADGFSPYVYRIDSFRSLAKIALPATGKLKIEFLSPDDIPSSQISVRRLGSPNQPWLPPAWTHAEPHDMEVSWYGSREDSRSEMEIDNLEPGRYQVARTLLRPMERGRDRGRSVEQKIVEVKANETSLVSVGKAKGRPVSCQLKGDELHHLEHATFEIHRKTGDFPFESTGGLYDFGLADGQMQLTFPSVEPGVYWVRVSGHSIPEDTARRSHPRVTHEGVSEIEVTGEEEGGPIEMAIEMFPQTEFAENMGFDLPLRLVNANQEPEFRRTVFRTSTGFDPNVTVFQRSQSTDKEGKASFRLPHDDHWFHVEASEQGYRTLFQTTTPVMDEVEIETSPAPAWYGNADLSASVTIDVKAEEAEPVDLLLQITNNMDQPLTLDQTSLFVQYVRKLTGITCASWIVFMPEDYPWPTEPLEPGHVTIIKMDWKELAERGIWSYPRYERMHPEYQNIGGWEFAIVNAGPARKIAMPKSPFKIVYEIGQTQSNENGDP